MPLCSEAAEKEYNYRRNEIEKRLFVLRAEHAYLLQQIKHKSTGGKKDVIITGLPYKAQFEMP